jgi:hypothetical protein
MMDLQADLKLDYKSNIERYPRYQQYLRAHRPPLPARARLAERGVEITEVMESPVCWFAFATDPEGNSFQIHQRKATT